MNPTVQILLTVLYILVTIAVCLKVIIDTRSTSKTLAYLLLIILVPVVGMLVYFSIGMNYRKNQIYSKKLTKDQKLQQSLEARIRAETLELATKHTGLLGHSQNTVKLILNDSSSPLTAGNHVELLINGEAKFPKVIEALEAAREHIHIEYYIYENDVIGNRIKEILIRKAAEGVKVRFIYDDFGSHGIKRNIIRELTASGVEAYPFHRIFIPLLANRLNYRNHRKIIVIDGETAFTGGINISDRYINPHHRDNPEIGYWRDTHLMIQGPGVMYLQYLFITSWRFCSKQELEELFDFFPAAYHAKGHSLVQIAASGPDSRRAGIQLALQSAISSAQKRLYITSPYFIPGDSMLNSIKQAALGGVDVRLLVPGTSDSYFVNAAAKSYYESLLEVGVRIFYYRKGFIHAKTVVVDDHLAIVGTTNMDLRSFELNFEVSAFVYDRKTNTELAQAFMKDLSHSEEIYLAAWRKRSAWLRIAEAVVRLVSPLL